MSEKQTPQTRTVASPIRSTGRLGFCFKPNVIISVASLVGMALASLGSINSSAQAQPKQAQPHRIIASRLTDRLIDEVDSPGGDHLILKPIAPTKNVGIAKTGINRADTKKKPRKAFRKPHRGTSKRLATKLKRRVLKRAERKIRREKQKTERIAKAKRKAELRKRLVRLDELQSDRLKKLYASRPVEFRPVPTLRTEKHNHNERRAMALRNRPAITRYEAAAKHPRPLKSSRKIVARAGLPQVIYGRRREKSAGKIRRELALKSNKGLVRKAGLTKKQKLAKVAVRKWAEGLYKKKLYKKKQTVGQYKKQQAKAAAPWRRKLSSLMH